MNNISIKIKPNSKYRKMIVKQVIFAYELRKSFAGARSYINELNPNFYLFRFLGLYINIKNINFLIQI